MSKRISYQFYSVFFISIFFAVILKGIYLDDGTLLDRIIVMTLIGAHHFYCINNIFNRDSKFALHRNMPRQQRLNYSYMYSFLHYCLIFLALVY